jgi:ribosomal protein S18 acetylase RimI-like enzyme
MSGEVSLRPGTEGDHDALWRIFSEVIAAEDTYAMDSQTTREAALAYWTENQGPWFVAEIDGEVVGATMIHPNQPGLGGHVANAAFVVDRAARHHHVGRALVEHAISAAASRGYRAMQFDFVVETNTDALDLYEDLGFEIIGRQPKAFHWRRERYVDAFLLYRSLDDAS